MKNDMEITSPITVHELLEVYPELEDDLTNIAPPFRKLKNPFLRKTVAKVATIKYISAFGGVPLSDLISKLREAVGQSPSTEVYEYELYFHEESAW